MPLASMWRHLLPASEQGGDTAMTMDQVLPCQGVALPMEVYTSHREDVDLFLAWRWLAGIKQPSHKSQWWCRLETWCWHNPATNKQNCRFFRACHSCNGPEHSRSLMSTTTVVHQLELQSAFAGHYSNCNLAMGKWLRTHSSVKESCMTCSVILVI